MASIARTRGIIKFHSKFLVDRPISEITPLFASEVIVKTFKWTVPEPQHESDEPEVSAFEYWDRVRVRGFEWYVVSKGVLFAIALPGLLVGCLDFDLSPEMLVHSWLAGLMAGGVVWSLRERGYERGLESGLQSRFESPED